MDIGIYHRVALHADEVTGLGVRTEQAQQVDVLCPLVGIKGKGEACHNANVKEGQARLGHPRGGPSIAQPLQRFLRFLHGVALGGQLAGDTTGNKFGLILLRLNDAGQRTWRAKREQFAVACGSSCALTPSTARGGGFGCFHNLP